MKAPVDEAHDAARVVVSVRRGVGSARARGPGDGVALAPRPGSRKGVAIGLGIHPRLGDRDPYRMATWVIENLAFGKYAISAYHDANSNAELDTGLFGIPTEDYGFSNNARASFGAPDYADAEFEFTRSGQSLTIRID